MNFFKCIDNNAIAPGFLQFLGEVKGLLLAHPGTKDDYLINILIEFDGDVEPITKFTDNANNSYLATFFFIFQKEWELLAPDYGQQHILQNLFSDYSIHSQNLLYSTGSLFPATWLLHYDLRLDYFDYKSFCDVLQKKFIKPTKVMLSDELSANDLFEKYLIEYLRGQENVAPPPYLKKLISDDFITAEYSEKIAIISSFINNHEGTQSDQVSMICEFAKRYLQNQIISGGDIQQAFDVSAEIIHSAISIYLFNEDINKEFTNDLLKISTIPFPKVFNKFFPNVDKREFFKDTFSYIDMGKVNSALSEIKRNFMRSDYRQIKQHYTLRRSPEKQVLMSYGITSFPEYFNDSFFLRAYACAPEDFSNDEIEQILDSVKHNHGRNLFDLGVRNYFNRLTIDEKHARNIIYTLLHNTDCALEIHNLDRFPNVKEYFTEQILNFECIDELFLHRIEPVMGIINKHIHRCNNKVLKQALLANDLSL